MSLAKRLFIHQRFSIKQRISEKPVDKMRFMKPLLISSGKSTIYRIKFKVESRNKWPKHSFEKPILNFTFDLRSFGLLQVEFRPHKSI